MFTFKISELSLRIFIEYITFLWDNYIIIKILPLPIATRIKKKALKTKEKGTVAASRHSYYVGVPNFVFSFLFCDPEPPKTVLMSSPGAIIGQSK